MKFKNKNRLLARMVFQGVGPSVYLCGSNASLWLSQFDY